MTQSKEPWKSPIWRSEPAFLYSRRSLARYVGRPAAEFLKIEPAAGVVLVICAVLAMLWANSPWAASYETVWGLDITFQFGDFTLHHTLKDWINDGLMAVFFFVVGVEIKSEIVTGELRRLRNALPPIAAALGGMIVPALIYTAFNAGGPGAAGWGIPMATDIAFAVGVLALFGSRIPSAARIFLLTLAIVDDLGAIAVIAVFYTDDLSMPWLGAAAALIALAVAMRLLHVWSTPVYLVIGVALWLAMLESGVHATIAGVVMGLIISARPLLDPEVAHAEAQELAQDGLTVEETERLVKLTRDAQPPADRVQLRLHYFSSFVVLPLFALANAGVALSADLFTAAMGSAVTLGIVLGLVLGKVTGITAATWLVVRLGIGRMPRGTSWPLLGAIGMVAGIGFTVALFITELAFRGGDAALLTDEGKIGVLCASLLAALLGALAVHLTAPRRPRGGDGDEGEDEDSGEDEQAPKGAAHAGLGLADCFHERLDLRVRTAQLAPQNLMSQPPATTLPDDAEARKYLDEHTPEDTVRHYPWFCAAWARLAKNALESGDDVTAYAFARTGYHRGLDQLRRSGWKGHGPIPWEHKPNRGFLKSLHQLSRSAAAIGEADEAARCAQFLRDSDPAAADALT
ncbi:Na+/H+ antiporter NhaA [Glycomyces harbinensis]|uniref:Na(+)/H(+) antiporter NhaA n=1 Tax=Glycomyces harbinensis TaxID=58114 RepID=A0A1G6YSL3_9ACTN|nr:Na+/H+ antiporter NhaA [Glycomyces harbinensis]SDD92546.1 Na+:H+ antiporter, NhaA family [Glycomyces harbinensis]